MAAPTLEFESEEPEPPKVAPTSEAEFDEPKPPKVAPTLESEYEELKPPKVAPTLESEFEFEYSKKGLNPYGDMVDFHDFIKNLLKANVNKTQLQDMIRRLKKKYKTNMAEGKKYNTIKPHELKVLDLSKKVWGSGEGSIAVSAGWRELGLLEGCLEFIGEPKLTELKNEWKNLHVVELELLVRRGELMREHAKLLGRRGELMREHAKLVRKD
ncbi:unnamed protein product [Prunus armeniaca]